MLVNRLIRLLRSTIRYKLLLLVLFPIVIIMPVSLALAALWGSNFTYEQLYIKVNTDLSVSHEVFSDIRKEYLGHLERLGESFRFHTALEVKDQYELQKLIAEMSGKNKFSYLFLLDPAGMFQTGQSLPKPARSSSALIKAYEGKASVGIEIFSAADLSSISHGLAQNVRLNLIDTPRARPTSQTHEDRGMMIRALYPIVDAANEVVAILDGGVLLNGNHTFVDTIRDLVYGEGSLREGSIGTVTVLLDDVRINTNVPLKENQRALGTRVSDEVRTKVLDQGATWIDRAFVVNDWYISSYEPIIDVDGKRVGMLYAGYLEAPYRKAMWQALIGLVILFLLMMGLSAIVSIRGAKSIFKPVESMSAVVQQTSSGDTSARIGQVESRDELGDLARGFDDMLDLLQHRSEEIQKWADQLEDKVSERTSELMEKNEHLSRTIFLLRQTHQKLVAAEKLAALGQLTAGVAHEINNPTQVILGNLDVLIQQMGDSLDPVREEVDMVIKQVYRIQEILNNLLQYARPSEYASDLQVTDVNEVVKDTLQLVQHLHKKHRFDISLKPKASIDVQINQQELQQVLVNLISNAVQALPEADGLIRIETADWEDKGVMISVTDNGKGISREDIKNIFNPFFSTKKEGEGTGLGLSVSYGLIRKYGGDIRVSSTPDQTTEFTVWLLAIPDYSADRQIVANDLKQIEQDAKQLGLVAGITNERGGTPRAFKRSEGKPGP